MKIDLKGVSWKVEMNGRKSLNGKRVGVTVFGSIEDVAGDIFDAVGALAAEMREESGLEYVDSIRISIAPPDDKDPR